jgi:hypothetical protein
LDNVGFGIATKATNDKTLPSYKISNAGWYSTLRSTLTTSFRRCGEAHNQKGPTKRCRLLPLLVMGVQAERRAS